MKSEDVELVRAYCYKCGNDVGNYLLPESYHKAPIVLKPSGWIVCKNCNARWRP